MRHTLLFLAALFIADRSFAALGGNESQIGQATPKARHVRRAVSQDYSIHDVILDSHTVHEWVNQSGQVFAVTWSGATPPALSQIFGDYTSEYAAAAKKSLVRREGRKEQKIITSNLLVERWGHLRDQHGRAILIHSIPSSLTIGAIQ